MSSRIKVGVVRGGPSSEYAVSLKTGETVLRNLPEHYVPIDIYISEDGKWHMGGFARSPEKIVKHVDVIFNALHGEYGEDGGIQELFHHHAIPHTGSGRLASALAMNKEMAKTILRSHGVQVPEHVRVDRSMPIKDKLKEIFSKLLAPFIVKPRSLGSSVGVQIARDFESLRKILNNALQNHESLLVEEYIAGREATCGVVEGLRGFPQYVLPITEIVLDKNTCFDYETKYSGKAREICPARFRSEEKHEIEKLTKLAHRAMGLRHYSRSDFIVHPKRGVYFLEVNTLPGLTQASLLPQSLEAVGVPMSYFLDHVIGLALKK